MAPTGEGVVMGYARYVGRVGGLAVALGVGVAIATTPGVAFAEEPAPGSPDSTSQAADAPSGEPAPAAGAEAAGAAGNEEDGSSGSGGEPDDSAEPSGSDGGMKVDSSGGAITSTTPGSAGADGEDADKDGGAEPTTAPSKRDRAEKSGSDSSPASTQKKPKRTAASTPSDSEISKSELTSDSNPSVQPRSEPVSAPVGNEVSVVDVAPQPATLTVSTAQDVPQVESAPESEVTPLLSTVLSAVGLAPSADGDIPEVPGDSPLLLAGLAALRRQTQQALTGDEALAKTVAEPSQSSLMLASADPTGGESMLLAAAVANSAPSVAPVVGSPDQATGAVVVSLHASDVDGNPLSYAVTGQPTGGSVEALGNGEFRYTPTVASRLAAAATSTPDFDTFTVTVSTDRAAQRR